jgi:hypothetical protein
MRICVICTNEFKNLARDVACSLKCKVLDGIKKNESGCWIWQKNTNNGIYGKLRFKIKWYTAHRAAYEAFVGPIGDKFVCHKCDIKLCCNPEHLFLGTQKENMKDAKDKGRMTKGTDNHFSRFTNDQIDEIRKLKEEGFTYERLQRIFHCSPSYLVQIIKQRNRKE